MGRASTENGTILLVANYESDVGYAWWLMENFWVQIAQHFSTRGRRCVLIYPRVGMIPQAIVDAGIEVVEHDFSDHTLDGLRRLYRLLAKHGITAVYLTDRAYYSWFYAYLRAIGVSRLVLHDHTPGERPRARGIRRWLKVLIYASRAITCDYYIGVSHFVYQRMIANACIPARRCGYVLNGIRPITHAPTQKRDIHSVFMIPQQSVIVASTGRATHYKGIDFIVRCAAAIVHDHRRSHVYFLHCGDGPNLEDFRSLARDLGLAERFIFAGRRADVREILPSCDIAIHASHGEAFSLSILEYLSAGLATVVPDNCGNAEAISDGVTGMLYRSRDQSEAVARLLSLIDDEPLRRRLATAAKRAVLEHFTIDRANRELTKLLDDKL